MYDHKKECLKILDIYSDNNLDINSDLSLSAIEDAYKSGYQSALSTFAWWKNGVQYVGSCMTTYKNAVSNFLSKFE